MRLSRQQDVLIVRTPAKLNLTLNVLGKRTDGYHDLETLMVSIGLYDTLTFRRGTSSDLSLTAVSGGVSVQDIPVDGNNLILRAARLLQEASGTTLGAEMTLRKRIPSQAGLGGGSSDAAATLRALNELWDLHFPVVELHRLASQLGSDVNFFLESPSAAICTGRGERILPIPVRRPLHFLVVKPATGLSTATVFRSLLKRVESPRLFGNTFAANFAVAPVAMLGRIMRNDLEPASRGLNSDVDRLLKILTGWALPAAMTGSGSACFALCQTARQARTLASRCQALGWDNAFAVSAAV